MSNERSICDACGEYADECSCLPQASAPGPGSERVPKTVIALLMPLIKKEAQSCGHDAGRSGLYFSDDHLAFVGIAMMAMACVAGRAIAQNYNTLFADEDFRRWATSAQNTVFHEPSSQNQPPA